MIAKQRYAPLYIWMGFSLLTVYCFAGGPHFFAHERDPWLYLYLLLVHVAIVVGYCVGIRRYRPVGEVLGQEPVNRAIKGLSALDEAAFGGSSWNRSCAMLALLAT